MKYLSKITVIGTALVAALIVSGCAFTLPENTPVSSNGEFNQITPVTPVDNEVEMENTEVAQQETNEDPQEDTREIQQADTTLTQQKDTDIPDGNPVENINEKNGQDTSKDAMQNEEKLLFDFTSEARSGRWMIVNDGVMGGISQSAFLFSDRSTAIFQGELSLENNGGFASVRTVPYKFELDEYEGISLRVLGDGRKYKLRFRTNINMDGPAYEAEFETIANEWMTVNISFQETMPVFRGRRLSNLPTLTGQSVTQIGIMLADKQEGSFKLELDWIRAF